MRPALTAGHGWDGFFFSPADPRPLGLIRIATGLLLLWSLAVLGLDLRGFLGADGWADPELVRHTLPRGGWSLWLAVPDGLLWPAWAACLAVLLLFTLGLGSRVMAPLAWIIAVSTTRRAPVIVFGFDGIVATWAFYLAVTGASGRAYSLDRWLAMRRGKIAPGTGPRPTVGANLALRLIQLHLCLIYLVAGLAKLQGPTWWDGSALGKLLGNSDFRPFDLTWIAAYPLSEYLLNAATHLALATEIGYAVFVWSRRWRPWVVGLAVLMHLGIALTLGLTEFALAMIVGNVAFVPGDWLPTGLGRGRSRASGVESGDRTAAPAGPGPGPAAPASPARPNPAPRPSPRKAPR